MLKIKDESAECCSVSGYKWQINCSWEFSAGVIHQANVSLNRQLMSQMHMSQSASFTVGHFTVSMKMGR